MQASRSLTQASRDSSAKFEIVYNTEHSYLFIFQHSRGQQQWRKKRFE